VKESLQGYYFEITNNFCVRMIQELCIVDLVTDSSGVNYFSIAHFYKNVSTQQISIMLQNNE